ncbi:MAG: DUF6132 family protein [Bacteroidota bacterium]
MQFVRNKYLQIIFLTLGAAAGFLYWKYIGCNSGTCAIKSVWYWSTLWGAAIGYLTGDFIQDIILRIKKRREKTDDR